MNFTYSKWHCYECFRRVPEGYGTESRLDEEGQRSFVCEECGKPSWSIFRVRIPEKDIKFLVLGIYQHWEGNHILVDGRPLMNKGNFPLEIIHTVDQPWMHDLKMAQAHHWNVHTNEDLWLGHGAWANTIHFNDGETLIPDDVFEAYKIFAGDPTIRRAIYRSEWKEPKPANMADWEQINQRVEYY